MTKILISTLGAMTQNNEYKLTKYKIDSKIYEEKFISLALYKHIKFDKIFMLGTSHSMWSAIYHALGGEDKSVEQNLYSKQLESSVDKNDLAPVESLWNKFIGRNGSRLFIVNYGLNNEELWDNFESYIEIANIIKDGDQIYLDITHSFRSLALMSYIMLDFIKSMRNKMFGVKAIYYGMFEYLNDAKNTEKLTPIVDLKVLFEISEWIKAISSFKNYGRAELVARKLKETYGKREPISEYFKNFADSISIANLSNIKSYVNSVGKNLQSLENPNSSLVKFLSADLIDFVKRMNVNKLSEFQFRMAKWFYENKNYALSYISLGESIVSKVCEKEGLNNQKLDDREKAKKILRDFDNGKYNNLLKDYTHINKIRNTIAHQSNRPFDINSSIFELPERLNTIESEFKKLDKKH